MVLCFCTTLIKMLILFFIFFSEDVSLLTEVLGDLVDSGHFSDIQDWDVLGSVCMHQINIEFLYSPSVNF